MKNFTRGKDGKLYYGKGTQGGLAPMPPQISTPASMNLPSSPQSASSPTLGGYSMIELAKMGFTADEMYTIQNKPAEADLPQISWGSLVMEDAEKFGYSATAKTVGGSHFVAAGYDKLVKIHDLEKFPKTQEEMRRRASRQAFALQQLCAAMKYSADEQGYSQEDRDRIDRVMAGYSGPDRINSRAFTLDNSTGEERLVYSRDAARVLDVAKVSYIAETSNPSERTSKAMAQANAKKEYMASNSSQVSQNGGYVNYDCTPSEALVKARVEESLKRKELQKEYDKKRTFDILGRGEQKIQKLEQTLAQYSQMRKNLEQKSNR